MFPEFFTGETPEAPPLTGRTLPAASRDRYCSSKPLFTLR